MNNKKIFYVIMTFILIAFSYCTVKAEGVSNNTESKEIPDSSAVVAVLSKYTYNTIGVIRTPSVTVTDANGIVLAKGVDYTVTYDKGRMEPGEYNVIVTLMGNYSGSRNLSFTIKGNSGKVNQSGKWSYKNKKVKGKKVRIKTAYQYNDGTYPVGATKIGKTYYYFKGTKGELDISSKKQRILISDGLKFDVASNGTLKKGWQVVKNKLYYFGGTYHSASVNKKIEGITLTQSGYAKKNLDSAVKKEAILLLDSITDRNASKKTQLRAVYKYMTSKKHLSYTTKNPNVKDKNWVKKSAYNMLTTKSGSCSGFAAMFTVMANEIGYKKTYVYYGRIHGTRDGAADGFTRHAASYVDGYLYDTEGVFAGWLHDGWQLSKEYVTFKDVKMYRYK